MRYRNPHLLNSKRSIKDLFLWITGYYRDRIEPRAPDGYRYPITPGPVDTSREWALWVNHTTYLIYAQGKYFLTDPIWSERCSPLPFLGPKRQIPPGVAFEELPSIDYVLISHDHYDHLDAATVQRLQSSHPNLQWVVPKGVASWFHKRGIQRVLELAWWEEAMIEPGFKITHVPAQHFSGRFKMNTTLWGGYVLDFFDAQKTLYFAGDTGYNSKDFKEIGQRWKRIDLALIPIGAYSPRQFMAPVHVEPRDAVLIHRDSGSRLSLATHWKTFRLSDEPLHQPPFDLFHAMQQAGLDPSQFLALEPGEQVNW